MERRSLRYLKWGILLDILDFRIGRWDLLPDFAGMLLLYACIQAQKERTQAEERVKPLFLLLAGDYFLHWVWQFENGVEGLLALVVSLYAVFVLLGEVAERIRIQQPIQAGRLETVRVWMALVQLLAFLVSPYGNVVLNIALMFAVVGAWGTFMVVVGGIRAFSR